MRILMPKKQAPKCIRCKKNLKRVSYTYYGKKEPYNGNMICYRKKTNPPTPDQPPEHKHDKVTILGRPYSTYDYTLWDGISYRYLWGQYKFCGQQCAAMWACAFVGKAKK